MTPFKAMQLRGVVPTTFDPLKCGPATVLSGGNLIATKNSGTANNIVLTTTSKTTGKHYFEIEITANYSPAPYIVVGVAPGSVSLTSFIGFDPASYGYHEQLGEKANNNVFTSYGSPYSQGRVIGVALDLTVGAIWFARDNVWGASGDPAAGTNPAFTGVTGPLFGGVSIYNGSVNPVDVVTARFALGATTYSPPSGFLHWG